jgi:hypothetical protein
MDYMFFLMCSERSGSNLITKIFDAHPDIAGPSTSHIADIIIPCLYKYGSLGDQHWLKLIEDILYVLKTKNAVWKKEFTKSELLSTVAEGDVAGLFEYIYMSEARANNKKHILIKENRIYEFAQFLNEFFTNARYIYMVRDPRDMAASWKHSYAIRGGVVRAANVWKSDQTGFLRMRSWICKKQDVPLFRYEDLISRPESILEKACSLLDVNYSEEMLQFHLKSETVANANAAADWQNIALPIMKNNTGNYINNLTDDEIIYIESLCEQEMKAFNYQPQSELFTQVELDKLEIQLLKLEPNEKLSFQNINNEEKELRRKQYEFSSSIRRRNFNVQDLI